MTGLWGFHSTKGMSLVKKQQQQQQQQKNSTLLWPLNGIYVAVEN